MRTPFVAELPNDVVLVTSGGGGLFLGGHPRPRPKEAESHRCPISGVLLYL